MNSKSLITGAKIINVLLIILTIGIFFYSRMLESTTYGGYEVVRTFNMIINFWRIASVVLLVLSILILLKLGVNNLGGILLVASAAVSTISSFLLFTFGIAIWILSGLSITKLSQGEAESSFRDRLRR